MKPSIRRALVASTTAIAAAGIALAAPASASATPEIIHDEGGVVVTFNDVDERTEDLIEYVVEAIDGINPQITEVRFVNLRGPRSAVGWNPNPRYLLECTQEEAATPGILCWSVLDD